MAGRKQTPPPASSEVAKPPSAPSPSAPSEPPAQTTTGAKEGRKPWVKKTPVEVVLEQIGKQEEKVNDLRNDLKQEERELQKLQQAKKVLEATD
jgi:hypothetical protein